MVLCVQFDIRGVPSVEVRRISASVQGMRCVPRCLNNTGERARPCKVLQPVVYLFVHAYVANAVYCYLLDPILDVVSTLALACTWIALLQSIGGQPETQTQSVTDDLRTIWQETVHTCKYYSKVLNLSVNMALTLRI